MGVGLGHQNLTERDDSQGMEGGATRNDHQEAAAIKEEDVVVDDDVDLKKEHDRPELKEWLKRFRQQILVPLLRNTKSSHFRKPVDAMALGVYPEYYQVVKEPMDLGTVKSKLDSGQYPTKESCTRDLMLVWNNAMTFNHPSHFVYQVAAELKEQCHQRLAQLDQAPPPKAGCPVKPVAPLARREGVRKRDARKRSFDLPGEVSQPQHLEQKYVSKLSSSLRACDSILKNLMSIKLHREYVEPFLQVEKKSESDSYQPMSLSRIQNRLRTQHYSHPMEFADDVRRIVTETYRYCHPDDPLISAAARLQQEFEMLFAKIEFQENETIPPILGKRIQDEEEDRYISKLLSAQNFMVQIQTDLTDLIKDYIKLKGKRKNKTRKNAQQGVPKKRSSSSHTPALAAAAKRARKTKDKAATVPKTKQKPSRPCMTLQEASVLKQEIGRLLPTQQMHILEILQRNREPLEPDQHGEVEIEIVKCSDKSVAEIKAFLARIKKNRVPPNQRQPSRGDKPNAAHLSDDSSAVSDSDSSSNSDSSSDSSSDSE